MSGTQQSWTCLNSPIEFWDDFKIPQSTKASKSTSDYHYNYNTATSKPPSPPSSSSSRSSKSTTPLDKLALALTCKRLLQAAALLLDTDHRHHLRIRVPSIRHHAHLEPPCPAVVRLQSIFPSPPERVGDGPPLRSVLVVLVVLVPLRVRIIIIIPVPVPVSVPALDPDPRIPPLLRPRPPSQRGSSHHLHPRQTPVFPPCPRPKPNPSPSPPLDPPTFHCPACLHHRPRAVPFWWTTLFRPRLAELRVSSFLDHPDDARDHPYYSLNGRQRYSPEELDAIDNEHVSNTAGLIAELWAEGIHLICPDCWLRAAKARPHANGLQPWRLLAFR
ncbi:hypothetical protein PG987_004720 [Apiospora arundinis]